MVVLEGLMFGTLIDYYQTIVLIKMKIIFLHSVLQILYWHKVSLRSNNVAVLYKLFDKALFKTYNNTKTYNNKT